MTNSRVAVGADDPFGLEPGQVQYAKRPQYLETATIAEPPTGMRSSATQVMGSKAP